MTKTPHPHAPLIHAWADGAKIEWFNTRLNKWEEVEFPYFSLSQKYRIAPELKKYRVALLKNQTTQTADNDVEIESFESWPDFVRWLTPWIEYTPDNGVTPGSINPGPAWDTQTR